MQYDLTRPNTGRVFDYWLGGNHNFEIDRQFADQVAKQLPIVVEQMRKERAKVTGFVRFFHEHGIRAIIDFGSSLPTCGNTHIVAHQLDPNIIVIYSDIDPVTAAYGQELLQDQQNVIYLQGDASTPLAILDAPETNALLGNERRVGINFLNLAHALTDDQLRASWQTIYDWVAPGSYMAVTVPTEHWMIEPYLFRIIESYRRSNLISYYRTQAELTALASPWQLTEEGILDNLRWDVPNGDSTRNVVITYSMMLYKT